VLWMRRMRHLVKVGLANLMAGSSGRRVARRCDCAPPGYDPAPAAHRRDESGRIVAEGNHGELVRAGACMRGLRRCNLMSHAR